MSMPTEIKIYNLISIFAGFVLCLILIKGFGKNENQQEQYAINSGLDSSASIDDMLNMLSEPSHSPDTLFYPASDSMAISNDTLGSFTIYDANGNSLKARSIAGMFWEVESNKPIRIKMKDGYLESMGDSIAWGFEYRFSRGIRTVFPEAESPKKQIVEMAVDFDDLVDKIKAKHAKGESWFIGSPLTESQYEYLKQMIDALPDTVYNVPKDTTSKKLN